MGHRENFSTSAFRRKKPSPQDDQECFNDLVVPVGEVDQECVNDLRLVASPIQEGPLKLFDVADEL